MSEPPRFFVGPDALRGDRASVRGPQARQMADVLRLRAGAVVVLVRDGEESVVRLDAVSRTEVTGAIVERRACAAEPRVRVTLALPLLRGDRSEEVVEATTQLGVARIVPLVSERSVVRELSPAKRLRWERIAAESAETARRGRVPEIGPLTSWSDLVPALDPPVIVAWEGEHERTLRSAIPDHAAAVSLVVGPEGGLTEAEVALARARGAALVSLGRRNLRSETAAVAIVAETMALLDQTGSAPRS